MRLLTLTVSLAVAGALLAADDTRKVDERLNDAADLFGEIMSAPDRSIPQRLLDKAACIVIVPGLKKGAFVVGGKYGKGFAVCRGAGGQGWGPLAAIRIEGGSFGLQIGVSSSDVVLLVMNDRGMRDLAKSKFTIGGEATAAAGPVGRDATAQTDALMAAEILCGRAPEARLPASRWMALRCAATPTKTAPCMANHGPPSRFSIAARSRPPRQASCSPF